MFVSWQTSHKALNPVACCFPLRVTLTSSPLSGTSNKYSVNKNIVKCVFRHPKKKVCRRNKDNEKNPEGGSILFLWLFFFDSLVEAILYFCHVFESKKTAIKRKLDSPPMEWPCQILVDKMKGLLFCAHRFWWWWVFVSEHGRICRRVWGKKGC